ncbi:MAG: L,D-transpeptidase [Pyrinomonadaceae bacterium]
MKSAILSLSIFVCSLSVFGQSYIQDMKRESARSDTRTGGQIEKAALETGGGDVKITINVPAFQMTPWQNGKEVKNYPVGVGMKEFPIIIALREINMLIWNPSWIPPDSEWVAEGLRGVPIAPTDPRNPLGKMKLPLGYGYLLHQAKGAGDLGSLVSHGCVRVMRDDIYDLSEKIIAAYETEIAPSEIALAKRTKKTVIAELEKSVPVEITYDTMVVEGGALHIYPDIYDRRKNNLEILREELKSNGIDEAEISDTSLNRMIKLAEGKNQYVIGLDKIRAGNLTGGKILPVVAKTIMPQRKR